MRMLPDIPTWENATLNTTTFLGLNRGLSIADGEMADMLNMSSENYPVLSTRRKRGKPEFAVEGGGQTDYEGTVSGMLGTDRLIVCSGEKVYMDGVEIPLKLSAEAHMQPKHLVSMGAYVCIWPDKKYFNVTNLEDSGDMGSRWAASEDLSISAMMCRKDGTNYDMESITTSDTAPAEPEDKQLWLDTSGENDVLKQYSSIYQEWIQVATTYIKIQASGIGKGLKESDVVHLSGVRSANTAATAAEGEETLYFPVDDFYLYSYFKTTHQGGTNYVSTDASFTSVTKAVEVKGIPEGAVIKSAVAKVTTGYAAYGAKILTMNGIVLKEGAANEIPVEVKGNGMVSLKFDFQSRNGASVSGTHGSTMNFTGVTIEVTYEGGSGGTTDTNADADQLDKLNTTNIIYGCGEDYIIVAGLLHSVHTLENTLVCEMKIPDLDYICEANNRLWGCSYSEKDGTLTNEIRCCALGDFRNWYKFEGTSMDSYVMSVGSDGKFTAAYALMGVPLMWKEGYLHKISGTQPSNFTLNTIRCRGVQDGSWRSLAVVNETLLYKARTDVMAYDGAMPYAVGEKLGTERYTAAIGGSYRDKYYLSMQDESIKRHTYVLDVSKGLWHKEDESLITGMANADGELILAIADDDGTHLRRVSGGKSDEAFDWSVTFGVFGYAYERSKYLSRFNIRAKMSAGSEMNVEIMYDSDGEWHHMGKMKCPQLRTFLLPIIPRRCDHCQVRIHGTGTISIYSVARVFEEGGN